MKNILIRKENEQKTKRRIKNCQRTRGPIDVELY